MGGERISNWRSQAAVNMLVDITERKQAEQSLRESEERFRQVVENIEEVFWMTDLEKNKMLFISSGYEKIWCETRESLYSSPRRWIEAIHPEDRDRVLRNALLKQTRGDYDEEYRIIRPDETLRWIHDRAFPIRNADGTIDRIAGIAEDVTERKQADEALKLRSQQQGALAGLGRRALERRDLGQLLDDAAALVPHILGIEFCCVLELLPDREALLLRARVYHGAAFQNLMPLRLQKARADRGQRHHHAPLSHCTGSHP